MTSRNTLIGLALAAGLAAPALAQDVAVVTPYLAQPGTQFYVDGFEARAQELGWSVNIIDTAGDVAAVISRMEDLVIQGVDAIVINVDPAQIGAGLAAAADAGIPGGGEWNCGSESAIVAANTQPPIALLFHGGRDRPFYVSQPGIGGQGNVVIVHLRSH